MTACRLCNDPQHIDGTDTHPCCTRYHNGRYCHSCEASKRYWRERTPRRKAKR